MKINDNVSVIDEDLQDIVTSVREDAITIKDKFGFTHQYHKDKLVIRDHSFYDKIKIKDKYEYIKPKSKKHADNRFILDLHFNKLVDQPEKYDSFERLFIQKNKLLETLDFCKEHRIKQLEVIHGIGDGTLQKLVYDTLESQYGVTFYNKDILHHQSGAVIIEISDIF